MADTGVGSVKPLQPLDLKGLHKRGSSTRSKQQARGKLTSQPGNIRQPPAVGRALAGGDFSANGHRNMIPPWKMNT